MNTAVLRSHLAGIVAGLMLAGCAPQVVLHERLERPPVAALTAREAIAGEIMAYLMEVVLGRAGPLEGRSAWASRGKDLPLSFDLVEKRMFGPVHQRAELMVLDTNILGISQVLYHYDPRLNLFKGRAAQESLYPCSELMALRLLMLRKLDRGETVSLAALQRYDACFKKNGPPPDSAALVEMNLSREEFDFLEAIFQSEPAFLRYMRHPFIISALKRIGIAAQDTVTLLADQSATYRAWACDPPPRNPTMATVAILPGMTALFDEPAGAPDDIAPLPDYLALLETLKAAIRRGLPADMDRRVRFCTPLRPMLIHPQNAGRVIETVCPKADFTVVLLGKNVYRALLIDPASDVYPHQRRLYLDEDDIRYHGVDDAVAAIRATLLPSLSD